MNMQTNKRLTGILVLDQNQKVTEQTAKDGDTMLLWQKLIESDYVCDIAKHPQKNLYDPPEK